MIVEIDYKKLGERIRAMREERRPKVTRDKLAEHVGVNAVSVYRWENNEGKPELDHLLKVAHFFSMGITELLGLEENNPSDNKSDLIAALIGLIPRLNERQLGRLVTLTEGYVSGISSDNKETVDDLTYKDK